MTATAEEKIYFRTPEGPMDFVLWLSDAASAFQDFPADVEALKQAEQLWRKYQAATESEQHVIKQHLQQSSQSEKAALAQLQVTLAFLGNNTDRLDELTGIAQRTPSPIFGSRHHWHSIFKAAAQFGQGEEQFMLQSLLGKRISAQMNQSQTDLLAQDFFAFKTSSERYLAIHESTGVLASFVRFVWRMTGYLTKLEQGHKNYQQFSSYAKQAYPQKMRESGLNVSAYLDNVTSSYLDFHSEQLPADEQALLKDLNPCRHQLQKRFERYVDMLAKEYHQLQNQTLLSDVERKERLQTKFNTEQSNFRRDYQKDLECYEKFAKPGDVTSCEDYLEQLAALYRLVVYENAEDIPRPATVFSLPQENSLTAHRWQLRPTVQEPVDSNVVQAFIAQSLFSSNERVSAAPLPLANGYAHNLMYSLKSLQNPLKGYYLYKDDEKNVHALIVHDTKTQETLDLSALDTRGLLNSINWPKKESEEAFITTMLPEGIVELITSNCKHTLITNEERLCAANISTKDVPKKYLDSITCHLMDVPVVLHKLEDVYYDEATVLRLHENPRGPRNPHNNRPIEEKDITPLPELAEEIKQYVDERIRAQEAQSTVCTP